MRIVSMASSALLLLPLAAQAQAAGKFPPDSLINVTVYAKGTPVRDVTNEMRTFAQGLGVRCVYCHVGEEGKPLAEVDFASDDKRPKEVARQMMRMVRDINQRVDTVPRAPGAPAAVVVTCRTCHRGVSRPVPLATVVTEAATAGGADSASRVYRQLRERHYGRDAYDFGEGTLNDAAMRLARAGQVDRAFQVLALNDSMYPSSVGLATFRGQLELARGDTTRAIAAYREALKRDPASNEAKRMLGELGQ